MYTYTIYSPEIPYVYIYIYTPLTPQRNEYGIQHSPPRNATCVHVYTNVHICTMYTLWRTYEVMK